MQLLGKTNLRNIVCYIISNGYVNKPVMFILFIIKIISYSNKEPCRSPLLDQETPNILLIQINRFSISNLHGRPRKNNHPFGIHENIKLGLINYTLLGLIEHHGVFIDSGHYVSYIRQSNKWYHCDDKYITETNLLTLSNNVCLMFYAKEVDLVT